ncbi:MAG: hypothetical protein E7317_05805 [Clostridiales bacterium]|nr:hypothetical protein [Clostridiales bacterium]
MKTKTKAIIAVVIVVAVIIGAFMIWWELNHGNRQLIDASNRFDRAVLLMPNGEVVEGKLNSWLDYADSDVVQVTIEGKTYLTHYANVCLIND